MRKFASDLSDDLALECQGVMLNRDMDFSRLSVHLQQVEEKKKKISKSRGNDRKPKRARIADQNHNHLQSGNWGGKWQNK